MDGFCQVCSVRGSAAQNGGAQVFHELQLTVGIAGGHGQGQAANLMAAAMEAHTAGEQAVAVSHVKNIFLGAAGGHDGTGAAIFPQIDIMLGIESHDTLAGGAGSGVNPDTLILGNAHKAVGISITQVCLGQERQLVQVIDGLDIVQGDALVFHLLAVVGHIVPHVLDLLHEPLVLQGTKLLIGHGFDFWLVIVRHG